MKNKPQEPKTPAAQTNKPEPKETKKTMAYFKNTRYSGLKVLVRGGEDELGAEGIKSTGQFVPYYDTWKGDTVRVGYLATDDAEVVKRCKADSSCEEIEEKEYKQAIEGDEKHPALRVAPRPQA